MIKFKVITLLIVLILSFFLSEYLIGFLSFITENISALGEYSYHLANESFIKMDQGNYIVKIFKNLAAVMYLLFIYNKSENSMKKIFLIFFLGIILGNMLPGLLSRIAMPLIYFEVIFFSYILRNSLKKINISLYTMRLTSLFIYSYVISKFIVYIYRNIGGFLPYDIF